MKTLGFENDQPGVYTRVEDGWWGVASHDQDRVAQESQGPIYDRTKEHLGASDQGVIMLRNMIKESMDAVRQGKDPIWIIEACGPKRKYNLRRQHAGDRSVGIDKAVQIVQTVQAVQTPTSFPATRGRMKERD